MPKKLVIANWKMNPENLAKARELFGVENEKFANVEVIICPPCLYVYSLANPKPEESILYVKIGAQNGHAKKEGPFTGFVSIHMLKQAGAQYIILGHSERKEKDQLVNKKVKAALKENLRPIVCLSKKEQILPRLKGVKKIDKIVLAYEPLTAIGSGNPEDPDEALSMKMLIQRTLLDSYSQEKIDKLRILYGGSVTSKNCLDYFEQVKMDGLLVGSASLDSKEFLSIIRKIDA